MKAERTRRSACLAALAVGASLALAACGSSGPSTGSGSGGAGSSGSSGDTATSAGPADFGGSANERTLNDLYQQATSRGQTSLVIYGQNVSTEGRLYAAFSRRFPRIQIRGVPAIGEQLDARLNAEFASGKHVGDVIEAGDSEALALSQRDRLQSYDVATASGIDRNYIGPNDTFWVPMLSAFGMTYNTNETRESDLPKTPQDLLAPQWRGRIAMSDPSIPGPMAEMLSAMIVSGRYSDDFVQRLKDQQPLVESATNIAGATTAVAQGQKPLAIAQVVSFADQARSQGAPVAFKTFESDTFLGGNFLGIVRGAPDDIAAELYLEWLFTPDGGKAVALDTLHYSPVAGSPPVPGLPPLDSLNPLPRVPLDQVTADNGRLLALARGIFGG